MSRIDHSTARRAGVTLVELVVAIALLGLTASVAGLTLRRVRADDAVSPVGAQVAAARRVALVSGRPVSIDVEVDGRVSSATAMPDGSVLADGRLPVDRFTGRASHVER